MPTATTAQERAQKAVARLPPAALAGLREAFADELAERLPRLREAARTLDPVLLTDAVRDVHTLGSSAYVVGENDAARTARAAEAILVSGGGEQAFARLVDELDGQLGGWRP